jgi:hypothetical protein
VTSNPQSLEHTEARFAEQTENERGKPILSISEEFSLTTSFVECLTHSEITQYILRSRRLLLKNGKRGLASDVIKIVVVQRYELAYYFRGINEPIYITLSQVDWKSTWLIVHIKGILVDRGYRGRRTTSVYLHSGSPSHLLKGHLVP